MCKRRVMSAGRLRAALDPLGVDSCLLVSYDMIILSGSSTAVRITLSLIIYPVSFYGKHEFPSLTMWNRYA